MRTWGLSSALCMCVGCYVGPSPVTGDASSGDETRGTDTQAESETEAHSGSNATSGPGDTSGDDGPMQTTGASQTEGSDDDGPMEDSSDSGGSTGEMSGCEGGPLPAPIPGCMPVAPPATGDVHQDCVDRINQFRWECQCLPPLARWNDAESCTDEQSGLDQNGGGPHGNFGMCGENAQNTCPNWGSEQQILSGCLQSMWDEGPGEPFSEHGHYINMSSMNYTRVACGFSSSGGQVWSNQNFAP